MAIPLTQVDAFTREPFRGNPAAVCVLAEEAAADWMQHVAAEMNLAETVFLRQRDAHAYDIRWFTPTVEVRLCGHATLASAHVLWTEGHVPLEQNITFHSQSGLLAADREVDWVRLDFPALPVEPCAIPAEVADALGVGSQPAYRNANGVYLIELASEDEVRTVAPDFGCLRKLPASETIITARSADAQFDFVSRFFAASAGIDEDPVTGSAHCSLGPFWAQRLGRNDLVGHQVSHRGGVVKVRALGDRVDLLGQAVTVLRGELLT
jgi:PhzF family phenazine biosynthesis protein